MKKVYEDHQLILINANRKLNSYSSFKKEIRKTEFLNLINSPQHKIAINKFRLSNHKLHIETGRHTTRKKLLFSAIQMKLKECFLLYFLW